jgi:hypothetical protein
MKVSAMSAIVLILAVAGLLKLVLTLTFVSLWRRRLRVHPTAPELIFVPRPDPGRQAIVGARSSHSLELAFHPDPGRQEMHDHDAFERAGLV